MRDSYYYSGGTSGFAIASLVVIIIAAIVIIWFLVTNIRVVPQAEAFVIERLGKYRTTWEAGLHLKIPFIERV